MSEHTLHHLTWISVVRVKSSVSTKCLTIFLWVCGLCHISSTTTVCHGNTSPSIWCHCMNSVILTCRTPLVCQSMWDPVGNCLMISRIHKITLTIITLIFNSTNREQTVGRPVQIYNILDSCNILQIIDNVSLSWSWHVCCSLPAHSKQTDPVPHHCLWYTCGTTDSRVISCSEQLNHCPLILAGQIHQLVHHL